MVVGGYPEARGEALEPPPVIGWGDGSVRVEGTRGLFHGLSTYIKQNKNLRVAAPSRIRYTSILIPPYLEGGEKMEAFVDYQNRVPHRVYIPSEDRVYKVRNEDFIEFLEMAGVEEVYIESAPKEWIYKLLDNNIQVYILRSHNQNTLRRKHNLKKNHENDAKLLYLVYKENPANFRKYCKRQLNGDRNIQRYILLLREIKRTRQKIKINEKLGLPTEKLKEYLKELGREQNKLSYYLKKRYRDILDKFSDIKGLSGGNLLYFLTLIQDIKSFRSTRSFLRYLGLRSVEVNKLWNREARDVLIKIAIKVAQYNDTKFNPRKPNWRFVRKLAITIYTRLRGGEVKTPLSPINEV